jgi:hypothetical protein
MMDSVLSSDFRAALKHHKGKIKAQCCGNELSLQADGLVTRLRVMRRSTNEYAFSFLANELLNALNGKTFFRFEPRGTKVVVEDSSLQFEQVSLTHPANLECKAVVRGEDLASLDAVQFVGTHVTAALEQTSEGTSLTVTDGYCLHHLDLSISPGSEYLVSTTLPPFALFKRGAVEMLCNDKIVVLKQNGLEVQLERKGMLPDYKNVLQTLRLYEQVQLPVTALREHLEPFRKDKKKQVLLTLHDHALSLDGANLCQIEGGKSLTLSVLAPLLFDALPEAGSVAGFLTGNSTPFILRSPKRWTLLVPIPTNDVVRGTGVTLAEALEPSRVLARAA